MQGRRRRASLGLSPALVIAALTLAGCFDRPTPAPIPTLRFEEPDGSHRCLVVMLPGRWDQVEDFRDEGFVADLRASGAACDAVAVDAHLGYYKNRTVIERLHQDVIAPARAAGYEEIWLAGISLGGVGSLFYLRDHPGEVAGALLLAPYLGEPEVIREVAAAGGPARWTPPAAPAEDDVGRILWSWLRQILTPAGGGARPALPPIYLGYGTADDFAEANGLLAGLLPRERVFPVPGGHDWPPWRQVWRAFLASGALPGTGRPT